MDSTQFFKTLIHLNASVLQWSAEATQTFAEISSELYAYRFQHMTLSAADKEALRQRMRDAFTEAKETITKLDKIQSFVDTLSDALKQDRETAEQTGGDKAPIAILKHLVSELTSAVIHTHTEIMLKAASYNTEYPLYLDGVKITPDTTETEPCESTLATLDNLPTL